MRAWSLFDKPVCDRGSLIEINGKNIYGETRNLNAKIQAMCRAFGLCVSLEGLFQLVPLKGTPFKTIFCPDPTRPSGPCA